LNKPVGEDLISSAPLLKCCEWIEEGVEYSGDINPLLPLLLKTPPVKELHSKKDETSTNGNGCSNDKSKTDLTGIESQGKPKFKILKRRQITDENGRRTTWQDQQLSSCESSSSSSSNNNNNNNDKCKEFEFFDNIIQFGTP
jgi:hypothetical protein